MPACGKESVSVIWATTPRSPSPSNRRIPTKTFLQINPPTPVQSISFSLFDLLFTVYHLICSQLAAIPTLWLCAWLWVISKTIGTVQDSLSFRQKRTVIVSGGSSLQALYIVRHLHKKGIRVILTELEGHFSLARFSNAVHRFYTLPQPIQRTPDYIQTLCDIVKKEGATYYIPLSSTNEAIYDALAKPYLEKLKCFVFCPRSSEVRQIDNFLEVLERCRQFGLPTPLYYPVTSHDDVYRLYDSGLLRSARHFITAVGSSGVTTQSKVSLPPFRQDFRSLHEVSPQRPWVVVQELHGEHLVSCCTLRDGVVVGNVTCRQTAAGLQSISKPEVLQWLEQIIAALRLRTVTAHLTFEIVVSSSGVVVPLGVRVGIPPAYICHTKCLPNILSRPCGHVSIEPAGEVVNERETIFTWRDSLPYCAYYHLYKPLELLRLEWLLGTGLP